MSEECCGHIIRFSYDSLGRLETETRENWPNTLVTHFTRDLMGRVLETTKSNAGGLVFQQIKNSYDAAGNIATTTRNINGTDAIESWVHRVSSVTRAFGSDDARTTRYEYTPDGLVFLKTLPSAVQLRYGYDTLGYKRSLDSSDGTLAHTYVHNRLGQLISATDGKQEIIIDRTLDAFGNILSEHFPLGLSVGKTYDAFDRTLSISWGQQARVEYAYDAVYLRRVTLAPSSDGLQYTHKYTDYDRDGNLRAESLMGDLGVVTHSVDRKGRKSAISSPYFHQHCAYDAADNLIQTTRDDDVVDYRYDDLDQLTAETSLAEAHTYGYDSRYNRVIADKAATTVNDLDECTSADAIRCTYDLNGNLVTKQTPAATWQFTYDPLNRLTQASTDSQKVEMTYDPLGRRLSKVTYTAAASGWLESARQHYLYDGENEIGAFSAPGFPQELRVLGLPKHENVRDTVAIELDGKLYVPLMDCHGNICRLIDPVTKTVVERDQFDAFGKALLASSNHKNPWRYTSKRYDPELQLVNFGKRYYDPQLSRWLTTDPAEFLDSTNLYQYVLNNPFKYYDPDGRFFLLLSVPFVQMLCGAAILQAVVDTVIVGTVAVVAIEGSK